MKLVYQHAQINNPVEILRKAGYAHFVDPKTNEESWVLRLTAGYYPRFHLYLEAQNNEIHFNLHLDQKKASYSGTSKHAGEYDGPTVEREVLRLEGWILSLTGAKPSNRSSELPEAAPDYQQPQPENSKEKTDEPPPRLFGGIFG